MIKKHLIILIVAFSILTLVGCAGESGKSVGKIIPPVNEISPLEGMWTVLKEINAKGEEDDTVWDGVSIQFAADAIEFGGHVWENPSYKIKRVDLDDYLMTKYVTSSDISSPENRKVDIITIYADSNFLGEVLKIDDMSMIFSLQNMDLIIKKVSDKVNIVSDKPDENQDLLKNANKGTSGVLLGLRAPSGNSYIYQTLWIAADQNKFHNVLTKDQLYFPRTSGFWELSVRDNEGDNAGNKLSVRNVVSKLQETQNVMKLDDETDASREKDTAIRVINYIGNDYISIERINNGINRLQMLPVDNLSSTTVIKIGELLGDEGLKSFNNSRNIALSALMEKGITSIEDDEAGENFGLIRENGHWFLAGRINYQKDGEQKYRNFDLSIIPPANLIFYDTLVLNWLKVKDRVPDALDVFTSPNKDIALVKTKKKLMVYTIGAEQLSDYPLAEIALEEGTAVIMAEWAIGPYVENWEKAFLSYGAEILSGSIER
jgi:hypothetical protein